MGIFPSSTVLFGTVRLLHLNQSDFGPKFAVNTTIKQKVTSASNSFGRYLSCIFILVGIAVIFAACRTYVCLFGPEHLTLPPLNLPTCMLNWSCTFIVFAELSSPYAYLDPYVYLDP